MNYETIDKLLDKHITMIFLNLYNDKFITRFSIGNNSVGMSKEYRYYYQEILGHETYDCINYYISNFDGTVEIPKFRCRRHKYKFEQIKTEEDIENIAEVFKQEILKEMNYRILWNIRDSISDLTKGIPRILCIEDEVKKLFIKEIKDDSIKLVHAINENLLSSIPEQNNLSDDNSLSSKKKVIS